MKGIRQHINNLFLAPVHIAPLVTFRILFGLMMMGGTIRFMLLGWIEDHYVLPLFHFKYYGFEWIEPLSLTGLYLVHYLLIIASLFVVLGLFYRVSALVVFLCFTYTELIDLTYYLNHYYFVSLVCLLMVVVPANRYFSLDVKRKPALYCNQVPAWCIHIFKLQLAIVYIYAGVIKINYDWLVNALPLKIWLPAHDKVWLIGGLFRWPYTPYFFSWAGMLYDCTIVFWLLWSKTRPWAYITVIFFHMVTGMLFQIGVFPVVMIGATLLFFSARWHRNALRFIARLFYNRPESLPGSVQQAYIPGRMVRKALYPALVVYLLFQLAFPWRFVLYPGNLFWTEQGYRFGWRVMLMEKAGTATFYVKDSRTGREGEVFNSDFLNPHQEKQMAMQPDMILQFAHFLGNYYQRQGIYKPQVRAEVYVTLNSRLSQLYIDPAVDLMKVKDGWGRKWWVKSYEQDAVPHLPGKISYNTNN